MGCDIHFYVEMRHQEQWVSADIWHKSDWESWGIWIGNRPLYRKRNYDLFAILADVRNGDELQFIIQPRGLPHDVSFDVQRAYEFGIPGNHSASWLTIADIINFDWTQTILRRKRYSAYEYYHWYLQDLRHEVMTSSFATLHKGNDILLSEKDMRKLIAETTSEINSIVDRRVQVAKQLEKYHCIVEREIHYYSLVPDFWLNALPHLLTLAHSKLEDVRIVFWFDN